MKEDVFREEGSRRGGNTLNESGSSFLSGLS